MLFTKRKYSQVEGELPTVVKSELAKMGEDAQKAFTEDYVKKRKGLDWSYVLVLVFFMHRMYLGYPKTAILQWVLILAGGIGLIWVVVDLILIPFMWKKRNQQIARDLLIEHKAMTID